MSNRPLLVTDLDGTLWYDGELCHPDSLEAFRSIQLEGIPILVATGRRFRIVSDTFEQFDWKVPCLLLNGSLCYDFEARENLFSVSFTKKESADILDIFKANRLSPTVYTDDSFVYACEPTTSEGHLEAIGPDLVVQPHLDVYSLGLNVLNFCILGYPQDELSKVTEELRKTGVANPSLYKDRLFDGYSLTVQPFNISKWSGIQQWCEHQNFSPSQIICVGDAGNDLEMLTQADKSIVVAGAEQRLLDLADEVIPPPDIGGWAKVADFL